MSESARRIEGHSQRVAKSDMGPQGLPCGEVAEVLTPAPEQLVDIGDGSLTFDTLVATRDALCKQAEELSSLLQVYDRAIAVRSKSGEREIPPPPMDSHREHAERLPQPGERRARLLPRSSPQQEAEPSMIVCMQSLAPVAESVMSPAPAPIKAQPPRPRRSREAGTETIRFSVPRSPRRNGLLWTAGIGSILLGLTMWAWLGVSLASSGGSPNPAKALPPAATAVALERTPLVLPFVVPAPEKRAVLPAASLSHFDVVWGDAPPRSVRVALRRSISKMKICFAQVSPDALEFPDKLDLSLRLHESGVVKWVRGGSSGGSRAVQECIESALYATVFPSSKKGLQVSTGLVFTPR